MFEAPAVCLLLTIDKLQLAALLPDKIMNADSILWNAYFFYSPQRLILFSKFHLEKYSKTRFHNTKQKIHPDSNGYFWTVWGCLNHFILQGQNTKSHDLFLLPAYKLINVSGCISNTFAMKLHIF